jgi:hypothetical protein
MEYVGVVDAITSYYLCTWISIPTTNGNPKECKMRATLSSNVACEIVLFPC